MIESDIFIARDEEQVAASQRTKERDYWLKTFSGNWQRSIFPTDFHSSGVKDYQKSTIQFKIDGDIFSRLIKLSNNDSPRLFVVLLTGLVILIDKYTNNDDITVGIPVIKQEIKKKLINTVLAIRNKLYTPMSFKELLLQVKQSLLEAAENQNYPIRSLLYNLNLSFSETKFPLFDIAILLENIHTRAYFQNIQPGIRFSFLETDKYLRGVVEFNSLLYRIETIERIISHYKEIFYKAFSDLNKTIPGIDILSIDEKNRILSGFNDTDRRYPRDKNIHGLFEDQVKKTPFNIAAVFEDKRLTYDELNKKSNQLARILKEKGIIPDTIVSIMVAPSLLMITGILAILKSGGVYLPIDPGYPEERKKYILKDSGTRILISDVFRPYRIDHIIEINDKIIKETAAQSYRRSKTGRHDIKGIVFDKNSHGNGIKTRDDSNLESILKPSNLAYVIYTSGTTGLPKGVISAHRGVVNTLLSRIKEYDITSKDIFLQLFSFSFDGFITSCFSPVVSGAYVILLKYDEIMDPAKVARKIVKNQVTHFISVPALYQAIIAVITGEESSSLKIVTLAGDRVLPHVLEVTGQKNKKIEISNEYGVTEAAVMSTIFRHQECAAIMSIGRPIANTRIYIANKSNGLQPIGLAGELWIGGVGIGRGYLNNIELTVEKFVENPFAKGGRVYRSGDLARWLPDGNIEFLGRIDNQVKIRGFRIEPGEIENRLLDFEEVKDAVVIDRETGEGEKYLCAYFVLTHRAVPPDHFPSVLRDRLSRSLPGYSIPPFFIELEEIPLTVNGKVNRKSLPKPEESVKKVYISPRSETEKMLTVIWSKVLEIAKEKISIDANFFELGGHSLKASKLIAQIHQEFDVKISLKEIFGLAAIRGIAEYLEEAKGDRHISIEAVEKKEYYPQSSAQKRMYILHRLDSRSINYNIPNVVTLRDGVEKDRLAAVTGKLIARHESLRTSFEIIEKNLVQRVHNDVDFSIEYRDRLNSPSEEIEKITWDFIRPFDLSKAPLLRVGVFQKEDGNDLLLFDLHHVIMDGTSQEIMKKEFLSLYNGEELPGLRLQYRDFVQWQGSQEQQKLLKPQEKYWMNEFSGELPVLTLPLDYQRPLVQRFEGSSICFYLDEEVTERLNKICRNYKSTLFMTLLSIYSILLSKLSGQEDIIIGTPLAGRRHTDLEDIIGMFVNTLPVRNSTGNEKRYAEFLKETKEKTLTCFENQDYPFEDIVEKVSVPRDIGRNPVFDVMFTLQNQADYSGEVPGSTGRVAPAAHDVNKRYSIQNKSSQKNKNFTHNGTDDIFYGKDCISKFDLTLSCTEIGRQILCGFEYCKKLFKPETIERFIVYFRNVVRRISENINLRIADIEITADREKQQILYEFNNTDAGLPKTRSITGIFESQVNRMPDGTAVFIEDRSITYGALNEKANQLARLLQRKGVKIGSIVVLMLQRSLELMIGVFGILKMRAVYLPIEPGYPLERIKYFLQDSVPEIAVTDELDVSRPTYLPEIIDLKKIVPGREKASNLEIEGDSPGIAYIIYTSGSTGKPKGVMIEHPALLNRIEWMRHKYSITKDDVILHKTSINFDVSIWELFLWAAAGAKLCLLMDKAEKDPGRIIDTIERYFVSVLHFVPSMLSVFLEYMENSDIPFRLGGLRYVFSSGEALSEHVVKKFFRLFRAKNSSRLVNFYGPTEAAVDVSFFDCPDDEDVRKIPIGKPIDNIKLFIVNKDLNLQPVGITGELCIAGVGLSPGYINRPELTAEKFTDIGAQRAVASEFPSSGGVAAGRGGLGDRRTVETQNLASHPVEQGRRGEPCVPPSSEFPSSEGVPRCGGVGSEMLYKTGDLVRWLPDGNIEFLGRMDHQVKIRGFRIEPGEIECRLLEHEEIKEAVVLARKRKNENSNEENNLCAYIIPRSAADAAEFEVGKLRDYLSDKLPQHMVPSYFFQIEKIPKTPNGKVDRKALPLPDGSRPALASTYKTPETDKGKIVAGIWEEVLNLDSIGIHDNFFELGGNSLKIIQVNSKLREFFKKDIPVFVMFEYPTISGFCYYLNLEESGDNWTDEEVARWDSKHDESVSVIEQTLQIIVDDKNE